MKYYVEIQLIRNNRENTEPLKGNLILKSQCSLRERERESKMVKKTVGLKTKSKIKMKY